jgi:hypothetical protein
MNEKPLPRVWVSRWLAALSLLMGAIPCLLLFAFSFADVPIDVRIILVIPPSAVLAICLGRLAVRRLNDVSGETASRIAARVGCWLGVLILVVIVAGVCVSLYRVRL